MGIKNIISNIKNLDDKKKHKIAKIVSFFVGVFFNILGIISVAIWKYLICNKDENSKYCIRLSIFGMIVKCVIFAHFILTEPSFLKPNIKYYIKTSNNSSFPKIQKKQNIKEEPFFIESSFDDDFFNFSFDMDKEFKKMNKIFKKNKAIVDSFFYDNEEENYKKNKEKINVKKEVKTKNGFETTTIEKTGPNSYQKSVNIVYVGDKKKDNKKNIKKIKNKNYEIR